MATKKAEQYELFDLRADLQVFEELACEFRKLRSAIASWHSVKADIQSRPNALQFTKVLAQADSILDTELAEGPGAGRLDEEAA